MNVTMQPGMDKCSPDEAPLTKYCYETHPSGYVVYEDYLPCMNSWIFGAKEWLLEDIARDEL